MSHTKISYRATIIYEVPEGDPEPSVERSVEALQNGEATIALVTKLFVEPVIVITKK